MFRNFSHIKERQRAGIEQAKKRGLYTGRRKGSVVSSPERARTLKKCGLRISEIGESFVAGASRRQAGPHSRRIAL
jgi:DNA invertase Pin-like site-specific DNA recombinase